MEKKKFEVETVTTYYLRKNGVLETQEYEFIGEKPAGDVYELTKLEFQAYYSGEEFHELYEIHIAGKLGFINSQGEIVIPPIYDCDGWMLKDRYLKLKKNGLCGLLKYSGTIILKCEWEEIDASKLSDGLVPVMLKGKWGFANIKTGEMQIKPIYDRVNSFKNGCSLVSVNKDWGNIDKQGNLIYNLTDTN